MQVLVRSKLKEGSSGLYRITYKNNLIYVGSFSNCRQHKREPAKTYFGSSKIAEILSLRKDQSPVYNIPKIELFEIWYLPFNGVKLSEFETKFILSEAKRYGVYSLVLNYSDTVFVKTFSKLGGRLINCHASKNGQLRSDSIVKKILKVKQDKGYFESKEFRDKGKERTKYRNSEYTKTENFKEVHKKVLATRRKNGTIPWKSIPVQVFVDGESFEFKSLVEAISYFKDDRLVRTTINRNLIKNGEYNCFNYKFKRNLNT